MTSQVDLSLDGEDGLWRATTVDYDAAVLDILLPKVDGLEILRRMRTGGRRSPVLLLTAKDSTEDRVLGLDSGADDYLVKPFSLDELLARLRALLRRGPRGTDGLLRHGETGNIVVMTKYPDARLIPQKATFEILDRRYVYVVEDDGVVKSRAISVAAELPHAFIVDGGLEDTDHVLLEGLRKVREGKHIEVRFEEPAEVFAQLKYHAE